MKVKDVIKALQTNFDLEEDIWYNFYTKDDLNDYDVKATDKEWLEIITLLDEYWDNDDFQEAISYVLGDQKENV
jgi:hypothetical protein